MRKIAATGSGERVATLAGGCFWCVEAVYRQLDGVSDVVNGYAGGAAATADYRTVSTGRSGHAEAVQVRYDPARVSYGELLRIFFSVRTRCPPITRSYSRPNSPRTRATRAWAWVD